MLGRAPVARFPVPLGDPDHPLRHRNPPLHPVQEGSVSKWQPTVNHDSRSLGKQPSHHHPHQRYHLCSHSVSVIADPHYQIIHTIIPLLPPLRYRRILRQTRDRLHPRLSSSRLAIRESLTFLFSLAHAEESVLCRRPCQPIACARSLQGRLTS